MEGKSVLFVGTKKQAQESVEPEAKRCDMYYVNNRWLGGMMTNFRTIKTRIARLNAIDKMEADGSSKCCPRRKSPSSLLSARSSKPTWAVFAR